MEIQRRQEYLDKILPELKSLSKSTKNPVVRYFEGKSGMRAIAEELFDVKQDELVNMIYSYDLLKKMFSEEEILEMRKKRQSKNIKAQIITNDEKNDLKTDAKIFRIPASEYEITSDIAIFGDKVRMVNQKGEFFGVIIESKEISNTLKILFKLACKNLKEKEGCSY